ncbi:ATP-binding protein [Roseiarcus sp.]|uniref:ATP-binding protein n=1 Tax=Roseiarcus sp. TaxID=1969460 RepID=UPI003F99FEC6
MEAERRQVVVLFADMVGFTTFSERFGEEAAFGLIQRLSRVVEAVVQAEGARIKDIAGDGVMVVFGVPVAQEDAPLRACRAALAILENLEGEWAEIEQKFGFRGDVRIGINAGPAVFGHLQAGGAAGLAVLGDTVNLASRVQGLAAPGTVLLSEHAARLVEGLVEVEFVGDHPIKGRSATEKVYRLKAVRSDASRFDASRTHGLTTFVGRERELGGLEKALREIGGGVRAFDIAGEPGIGKSRLLHEFRERADKYRALVLTGGCTSEGRETAFRAFIDVARGLLRIARGDNRATIENKVDEGLRALSLRTDENCGLLLNLFGHEPSNSALAGLDGVLIGLRTREVLRRIIHARARLAPLVLAIEDTHWIDSASEQLLASVIATETSVPLLLLLTRRPIYSPPWLGKARVVEIALDPLSDRETSRIAQARLGVERLPDALYALIAEKAEGNALFAEEIVAFLMERRIVSFRGNVVEFDAEAVGVALPQSVQSILAARVDQLPQEARRLLQTAAVIGRRFDPHVVLALTDGGDRLDAYFADLEAQDFIHRDEASGVYVFKHILLRDAIYDGLLSAQRVALHRKVAEELERRSSNSLLERAESLAQHFAAAEDAPKAFRYLVMAARKSLNVYAIPEAESGFRKALTILESGLASVAPREGASIVVGLLETMMLKSDYREAGRIAETYMPVVKAAGETPELVVAYYYQTLSLVQRYELRAGLELMTDALAVAEKIGDPRALAFAQAGLLHCRTRLGLDTREEAERRRKDVMESCLSLNDNFLRNSAYFFVVWDCLYRGLLKEARALAIQQIASGEATGDPRAISFANWILGWINVVADSPGEAIAYADECLRLAVAPLDRLQGENIKTVAAILSGRGREALPRIEALNLEFERLGTLYNILDGPRGVALIETGRISEGVRVIKQSIAAREAAGDRTAAGFFRLLLAEIYIRILNGGQRPPLGVILRNLPTLVAARLRGARRASALIEATASHPQFDAEGVAFARIDFNRGQLWRLRRRPAKARACFERACRAAEAQGLDALRRRSEEALALLA